MTSWEERMSRNAQTRVSGLLGVLKRSRLPAELPEGASDDLPRHWCAECGLADPPVFKDNPLGPREPTPCPGCGSEWRWFGRIADIEGTAEAPPPDGPCSLCYEWRRYPHGQEHFGWTWWLSHPFMNCPHHCAHHDEEVWVG